MSGLIEYYARRRRAQADKRADTWRDAWDPKGVDPEVEAAPLPPEQPGADSSWTNGHVRNVRPVARRRDAPRGVAEDGSDDYVASRNRSDAEHDAGPAAPADGLSFYDRSAAEYYARTERVDEEVTSDGAAIDHGAAPDDASNVDHSPRSYYRGAQRGGAGTADEPAVEHRDAPYTPQDHASARFEPFPAEESTQGRAAEPAPADEPSAADEPAPDQGSDAAAPAQVVWHSKPSAGIDARRDAAKSEHAPEAAAVYHESPTVEIRALTIDEVDGGGAEPVQSVAEPEPAQPPQPIAEPEPVQPSAEAEPLQAPVEPEPLQSVAEPQPIEDVKPAASKPFGQAIQWPPRKPALVEQAPPDEPIGAEPPAQTAAEPGPVTEIHAVAEPEPATELHAAAEPTAEAIAVEPSTADDAPVSAEPPARAEPPAPVEPPVESIAPQPIAPAEPPAPVEPPADSVARAET
ncbi:MAG: hypothetical protein M3065_19545, partial [Actinomycetota bacterium]|nr:hypothetical protein [Actinomycetota bacterium]